MRAVPGVTQVLPRVPAIRAAGAASCDTGPIRGARPPACGSRAITVRRPARPSACCRIVSRVTFPARSTRLSTWSPPWTARSVEAAADILRPEITLPSAVRWVRRRLTPIRRALLAIVTLVPDLFTGDARLAAVRAALGLPSALVALRTHTAPHLATLPTPLGFQPRSDRRDARRATVPHGLGADRAGPSR